MRTDIIQTGSSGNCVLLDRMIALDMGVSFRKIVPYMRGLKLVFVSHCHSDHFTDSTILNLSRSRPALRFCGGEWMVPKFVRAGVDYRNIDILTPGKVYDYGLFQIEPFELYHDTPNLGLKIYKDGQKAVYIVDTGHLDGIEAKDFDIYLVEANHYQADIEERAQEKLKDGKYSYEIRAAINHLSFEQASEWLRENMSSKSIWFPLHMHEERREECQQENDTTGLS